MFSAIFKQQLCHCNGWFIFSYSNMAVVPAYPVPTGCPLHLLIRADNSESVHAGRRSFLTIYCAPEFPAGIQRARATQSLRVGQKLKPLD